MGIVFPLMTVCVAALGLPPKQLGRYPNDCLLQAVAFVARQSTGLDHRALSQNVVLHNDGVRHADLSRALERQGYVSGIVQVGEDQLLAYLRAGLPVALSVRRRGQKHALVVYGFEGTCTADAGRLLFVDPATHQHRRASIRELLDTSISGQAMVVFPTTERALWEARLRAQGVDPDDLKTQTARHMAEDVMLRAWRHPPGSADYCSLVRHAADTAPSWYLPRAQETQCWATP
jgi:hypothetical protein